MAIYAVWNNKGGVGKSYLTFQVASEYARSHPNERVLVVDLCPQANSSGMLLGGMPNGEVRLDELSQANPRRTIAGYIEERIVSPYVNPRVGERFVTQVSRYNPRVGQNLYLVVGDEQLEVQASRVASATNPGPQDAWRIVHTWISDLVGDIQQSWNVNNATVFIDCNPSFTIYTELAMSASDRLIIPFSADGSSKRAVRAVLALLYGITRVPGAQRSEFYLNSQRFRLSVPQIYCYVGNRLTQYVTSAGAFRNVVNAIGDEIWTVWRNHPDRFATHPPGAQTPGNRTEFKRMFQYEIRDANTASVVSSTLGIPIVSLHAGMHEVAGKRVMVNQVQVDAQIPNVQGLVAMIT